MEDEQVSSFEPLTQGTESAIYEAGAAEAICDIGAVT